MQIISIIGTGYVGLVTGSCLAYAGQQVTCIDISRERIQYLLAGKIPIYEPELDGIVQKAVTDGKLSFSTSNESVATADVIFIAVGTPQSDSGAADLQYLEAAIQQVADTCKQGAIIVIRSTVPPGTGLRMQALVGEKATIVNAPEFLAEGTAVKDFLEPNRIVAGGPQEAAKQVLDLWANIKPDAPRIQTDNTTAELAKYASNTFLAARVSLVNEMANLCDALGGGVKQLAHIVGLDDRIGAKFLRAGVGYGGSCFPKDVQALLHVAREAGIKTPVAQAAEDTNHQQWRLGVHKILELLGNPDGKKVAFLGIAFKPGTDDTREAPGLKMMQELASLGCEIAAFDPVATLPEGIQATQHGTIEAAITGAHVIAHVTEWPEFAELEPAKIGNMLASKKILDGRNTLNHSEYLEAGFTVATMGARL